jgi:hypothetical protein
MCGSESGRTVVLYGALRAGKFEPAQPLQGE